MAAKEQQLSLDVPTQIDNELLGMLMKVSKAYDAWAGGSQDADTTNDAALQAKDHTKLSLVDLFGKVLRESLVDMHHNNPQQPVELAPEAPVSAPQVDTVRREPISAEAKLQLLEGPQGSLPRNVGDDVEAMSSHTLSEAMFDADEVDPLTEASNISRPQAPNPPVLLPAPLEWQTQIRAIQNLVVPYRDDPDATIRNLSCTVLSLVASIMQAEDPTDSLKQYDKRVLWDGLSHLIFTVRAILRGMGKYTNLVELQRDMSKELNTGLAAVMEMNIPEKSLLGKEEEVEGEAETEVAGGTDSPSD